MNVTRSTVDGDLDLLAEVLRYLSPLSLVCSWEGSPHVQPTPKEGRLCTLPPGWRVCRRCLEFFCMGYLSLRIYLYILMGLWVFIAYFGL